MDNIIKSKTRLVAVQIIFQNLINKKELKNIKEEFDKFYKNKALEENGDKIKYNINFLNKLLDNYIKTSSNIDFNYEINKYIKFERIFEKWDLINKSILMMAISELKNCDKHKKKIIINEYIELSKLFINLQDRKIINVILDKFLNEKID